MTLNDFLSRIEVLADRSGRAYTELCSEMLARLLAARPDFLPAASDLLAASEAEQQRRMM